MYHKDEKKFFVTCRGSHCIKKISPSGSEKTDSNKLTISGVIEDFVGVVGTPGNQDGVGSNALFNFPWGLAINPNTGFMYASSNHCIRKITTSGNKRKRREKNKLNIFINRSCNYVSRW